MSAKGIFAAIRINDEDLFDLYLFDRKANPNARYLIKEEKYVEGDLWFAKDQISIQKKTAIYIPVIFWAVRNVYGRIFDSQSSCHNAWPRIHKEECEKAKRMLQALVDAGARLDEKVEAMVVCNIKKWNRITLFNVTPESFIMNLIETTEPGSSQRIEMKNLLIGLFGGQAKDGDRNIQESVRVPKTIMDTWKSLTFNEKYSDIHFQCQEEDGSTVSLPAHKNILAQSSVYFDAMFSEAWLESAEGVIKSSYPANIIRALLTFLYTGVIEDALLQEHAVLLLSLAAEYMLPELQKVAERTCVKKLAIETVRDMLIVADNLGIVPLKDACFNFIRRHCATVLMDEDMVKLSTERPALWSEIRAALQASADKEGKENGGGEGNEQGSKKRQRET